MSYLQRATSIFRGLFTLLLALILVLDRDDGYLAVMTLINISWYLLGFRLLFFYFTMSRHMVGGKASLYQAVIVLDFALFTTSLLTMERYLTMMYLLGIFAFSGFVDILRALEAKKYHAAHWKFKLMNGCVTVVIPVLIVIFGFIRGKNEWIVYSYCISLVYSGVMRIISALRRSAIMYIQ